MNEDRIILLEFWPFRQEAFPMKLFRMVIAAGLLVAATLSLLSCAKTDVIPKTEVTSAPVSVKALKRSVVKIIAHKPGNVRDTGAGIVAGIEKNIGLILTAHHVVEDAQRIEVVFFDKQFEKFQGRRFERYHEDLDIAVITVEPARGKRVPPDLPRFTLGDASRLKEGEKVSTIGHPLDLDWQSSIKTNAIAALSDRGDFRKFRFTKAAIERGSSGGPVLDERGSLIGMVTKFDPVHAVAVKISDALLVLNEAWRIPTANLARLGTILVNSKPSGAQVFLEGRPVGSTTEGPVTITGLEPGRYSLRVTKEEHTTWEESIEVKAGTQTSILAELEVEEELPGPPSFPIIFPRRR